MLHAPDTETTEDADEVAASRFSRIFCTESEGPINALVVEEERLRKLAAEMLRYSPELASILASSAK